jgi:hypothetical protein
MIKLNKSEAMQYLKLGIKLVRTKHHWYLVEDKNYFY